MFSIERWSYHIKKGILSEKKREKGCFGVNKNDCSNEKQENVTNVSLERTSFIDDHTIKKSSECRALLKTTLTKNVNATPLRKNEDWKISEISVRSTNRGGNFPFPHVSVYHMLEL